MNIEEYISSGILESYALGLTTSEENALLECLVKTNPVVAQELRSIQEALEIVAQQQAITPPDDLKSKIWNEISKDTLITTSKSKIESATANGQSITDNQQKSSAKVIRLNWLNIAASLILIVSSSSFAVYFYLQNKQMNEQIAILNSTTEALKNVNETNNSYLAFLANKQTERVPLSGVPDKPDAKAVVFWNKENKHVMISEIELPEAPKNMQYQLWALMDGKPIDAGVIDLNPKGKLLEMKTIEKSQAFAVTLEPMGGSPSPHLEDLCMIGTIK